MNVAHCPACGSCLAPRFTYRVLLPHRKMHIADIHAPTIGEAEAEVRRLFPDAELLNICQSRAGIQVVAV